MDYLSSTTSKYKILAIKIKRNTKTRCCDSQMFELVDYHPMPKLIPNISLHTIITCSLAEIYYMT